MTRFKRASGTKSASLGRTCNAPSPCEKTTRLCLMRSFEPRAWPWSCRTLSSASAAFPLYNRKWLQAFKLTAIALSGCACKYTAKISNETS